jgi:hypothetical protein
LTRVALHIGYRKTATTWVQEVALPHHPDIRSFVTGSPVSDPFLDEIIVRPDRLFDVKRARSLFQERVEELAAPGDGVVLLSAERISGHPASGGFDAFRIASRLHEVVPDARVFAVVREQVSMIESEYRQLVREGSPAHIDRLLSETANWKTVGFNLEHYEYDLLADEYARLFGAGGIRLFEYEALTAHPREFLDGVAEFLEIEPWPELSDAVLRKRVNSGVPRRLLGARRFMNHFERSALNPYPVVSVPPVWRRPLGVLSTRLPEARRPFIDEDTRDRLRERYRPSNERLTQRYGIVFG